jgi:acyl dehydratase
MSRRDSYAPGQVLPALAKGTLSSSRIVRWCAAQENWDKIHYDIDYSRNVAKLPYTVINGALKQHFLVQFLAAAFGKLAWIWQLEYRFTGMDLVGQALEVGGAISTVSREGGRLVIGVDIHILNIDEGRITCEGKAVVMLSESGEPILDAAELKSRGESFCAGSGESDPGVPEAISQRIGSEIEQVRSYCPVDLSRLRLFAEAVMDISPYHYDSRAGAASAYGNVVGTPLFPIHALSQPPGARQLSLDPMALGREGTCEVGRNLPKLFGLSPQGLLNGGNSVQIHSLVMLGETVEASSYLTGARFRKGKRGGSMLIFETTNEYKSTSGRPLLTERQSIIQRQLT